jgi:hypothetical protein
MKDYGKFEPVHERLARRSARTSDGRAGPRCGCKDPENGRQLGERCPDLRKRHRGTWAIEVRIDTSKGRRKLHRAGYAKGRRSRGPARSDPRSRAPGRPRCDPGEDRRPDLDGDPPQRRTARRRGCCCRLALGTGPARSGETFGQAWTGWLAAKKRLRRSSRRRLEQIGRHWLLPVLDDVATEDREAGTVGWDVEGEPVHHRCRYRGSLLVCRTRNSSVYTCLLTGWLAPTLAR